MPRLSGQGGSAKEVVSIIAKSIAGRIISTPFKKSSKFSKKSIKLFRQIIESQSVNASKPFFIFINFLEAHEIYRPPLRSRQFSRWFDRQPFPITNFWKPGYHRHKNKLSMFANLYDDEIYFLDQVIMEIWNICKKNKILDQTVFIITSDHGEHLGEKDLYEHQLSLYNELIWVPIIIHFPKYYAANGEESRLAMVNDLYATILDLADSPMPRPPTSLSLLGNSKREFALAQIISEKLWEKDLMGITQSRGAVFSPPALALMTAGGMKIIERRDGRYEIYDLNRDRDEGVDLAPNLRREILENYHTLMEFYKEDNAYCLSSENVMLEEFKQA
jgi:arylsulfatase A-like enzyme